MFSLAKLCLIKISELCICSRLVVDVGNLPWAWQLWKYVLLFFQVNKNFLWTVMLCERFRGCKHDPLPARSRVPCVQGEPLPGWVPITSPLLRLGCCPRSSPSGDVARCARHTASWHHTFGSFCWIYSWLADCVLIENRMCVYLCLFICVLLAEDKAGAELGWLNTTIFLPFSFFSTSLCTRGNHGCLLSFFSFLCVLFIFFKKN